MKIAHLILTHKNPTQLGRLIRALGHPDAYFFIHIDKKTDLTPFLSITQKDRVFLIKDRVPIYWAGFGTIQATINGFREILAHGSYDYVNVISGQDFPLRSASNIHEYISTRQGAEFITCEPMDGEWNSSSRIRKYHLINWRIPGKFKLEKWINKVMPPRKFPLDHDIVGRANWFTLTTPAIRYSLDFLQQHPELIRFYKYCWGADEFIFSTILFNSSFRPHIVDNLVYVDWTGQIGHPRFLTSADLPTLQASEKLFARKVDMETDPALLTLLEKWTGAGNN